MKEWREKLDELAHVKRGEEEFKAGLAVIAELESQGQLQEALESATALRGYYPNSEDLVIKLVMLKRELHQIQDMVWLCLELSAIYGRTSQRSKQAELLATLPYIDEAEMTPRLLHKLGLERADMLRFYGHYEASLIRLAEVLNEDMDEELRRETMTFLSDWLLMGPGPSEADRIRELLNWLRSTPGVKS